MTPSILGNSLPHPSPYTTVIPTDTVLHDFHDLHLFHNIDRQPSSAWHVRSIFSLNIKYVL